jgi:hypothetical protein
LKFLLDQWLSTIPQHHWAGKLLGFDFRVEFKSGASNVMANTLSHATMKNSDVVHSLIALLQAVQRALS